MIIKRLSLCWAFFSMITFLFAQEKEQSGEFTFQPSISLNQTFLTQGFDPWQHASASVAVKKDSKYIITPGFSYFRRFNSNGYAFTLDNYYFLPNQWYVNAMVRVNQGVFLPSWDYTLTLYKNIGKLEFSVGFKQLFFAQAITLLPVSIGVYVGNYWISYQNFTGRESNTGRINSSNLLSTRRYLNDAQQYLELKLGLGQELNILSEKNLVTLIPNQMVAFGYQHPFKKRSIGVYSSVTREEIRSSTIRYRTELTVIFK
jgi:YaiO family outer membrane protein